MLKMSKNLNNKICGECRHFEPDNISACCEAVKIICNDKAPACSDFEPKPKPTLFDRITANEETLAKELTYWQYDPDQSRCGWTNNVIVGELYKNYHEAIAATVAKLKEVADA